MIIKQNVTQLRTETGSDFLADAGRSRDSGEWQGTGHESAPNLAFRPADRLTRLRTTPRTLHSGKGHPLAWFVTNLSRPIAWTLVVATVLMIIAFHSDQFVGVSAIASLTLILVMMALRASTAWTEDSHQEGDGGEFNGHAISRPRPHHS